MRTLSMPIAKSDPTMGSIDCPLQNPSPSHSTPASEKWPCPQSQFPGALVKEPLVAWPGGIPPAQTCGVPAGQPHWALWRNA